VYEAFASFPYQPTLYDYLPELLDLRGKLVADVGAGTGKSTRSLAKSARQVFGIEREVAMLGVARANSSGEPPGRVSYLGGDALALPLADGSVDVVTGITLALWPSEQYRTFIQEGRRVARGLVMYLGIAPGWYRGDLYEVIEDDNKTDDTVDRIFLEEFHFAYRDVDCVQEYGTLDNITSTYGFIFGKKAIEYLKQHNQTSIHWRFRAYFSE
jgi:ubiquinone/menaquinone biosynthesis C-methylase UbiE